ncbi:unnamed protein product [Ectocarpus sp. 12 AP-2014]
MVGRAAYFDPWTFRHTDSAVFGSSDPGFTRREIMERCVDRFTEMMQEGRREGPECNRTRHLCLGTVTKPLGYLSSGARVKARVHTIKHAAFLFVCVRGNDETLPCAYVVGTQSKLR